MNLNAVKPSVVVVLLVTVSTRQPDPLGCPPEPLSRNGRGSPLIVCRVPRGCGSPLMVWEATTCPSASRSSTTIVVVYVAGGSTCGARVVAPCAGARATASSAKTRATVRVRLRPGRLFGWFIYLFLRFEMGEPT